MAYKIFVRYDSVLSKWLHPINMNSVVCVRVCVCVSIYAHWHTSTMVMLYVSVCLCTIRMDMNRHCACLCDSVMCVFHSIIFYRWLPSFFAAASSSSSSSFNVYYNLSLLSFCFCRFFETELTRKKKENCSMGIAMTNDDHGNDERL